MNKPTVDEILAGLSSTCEEGAEEPNRYTAVMATAKRARQINSYYHSLGENTMGIEELTPPLINTRSTNLLTIAFEEIVDNKIEHQSPK